MFLIAKNNPAKFNFNDRKIKKIQKFCNKIYANILCGSHVRELLRLID